MMTRIYRNAVLLLICSILGGLIAFGWEIAVSVLIGGLLAILNFHWLTTGVDLLLKSGDKRRVGSVVAKYLARLVLIFVALFAIIHFSFLDLLGALVGLSVFVLSGMVEAVILLFKGQAGVR